MLVYVDIFWRELCAVWACKFTLNILYARIQVKLQNHCDIMSTKLSTSDAKLSTVRKQLTVSSRHSLRWVVWCSNRTRGNRCLFTTRLGCHAKIRTIASQADNLPQGIFQAPHASSGYSWHQYAMTRQRIILLRTRFNRRRVRVLQRRSSNSCKF